MLLFLIKNIIIGEKVSILPRFRYIYTKGKGIVLIVDS